MGNKFRVGDRVRLTGDTALGQKRDTANALVAGMRGIVRVPGSRSYDGVNKLVGVVFPVGFRGHNLDCAIKTCRGYWFEEGELALVRHRSALTGISKTKPLTIRRKTRSR